MTGLGQNLQCSDRAEDFCLASNSRHPRLRGYTPLVKPHRRIALGEDTVVEHPQTRKLVADAAHLGVNFGGHILELISLIVKLAVRLGFEPSRLQKRASTYSGNPAFRRPSISSFAFDCPPRAIQ